jgi:hypothetical protein
LGFESAWREDLREAKGGGAEEEGSTEFADKPIFFGTHCASPASIWISFDDPMAEADAKHWFAFIPFESSVNSLAVFVTHLSAEVCRVDRRLLAWCELVPQPFTISVHALL